MLSALASAIMVMVAVWESISLRSDALRKPQSEKSQSEATSA
jgi:hypothetical protein